ncbi:MAG: ParB/RepB/Spo0J family partition protein [Bacteroidales bacterium]|nr:ParB/RepB/Spo0J family partition protein [Bacteroidales bacterium]
MINKKGLGKGLEALFSNFGSDESESGSIVNEIQGKLNATKVIEIEITKLEANPNQPRKIFNDDAIKELSESIKQHGVIQPIIVSQTVDKFMVIAGERRLRASMLANLKTIPCIIKNYTERQIKEVALIENLQREDLNPLEAARAIKQLMEEYKLTQETVSEKIGKSRSNVANLLRLLNLHPEVLKLIEENKLTAGHARVLASLNDGKSQINLAQKTIDKQLSVRDLEKLAKIINPETKSKLVEKTKKEIRELEAFTEEMQRVFATKVTINGDDKKGRIVIDYFSRDDLDRIFELVSLIKNKKLTLQNLSEFNHRNNQ